MIDIKHIASQVKDNCNISDANYWGYYSPCGLLLRMRDLYRIETGMNPWESINNKDIGSWIHDREALWQDLEGKKFKKIRLNGKEYEPFDAKGINTCLEEHGYVYSAGYGNMMKPVFVLAGLDSREKNGRYRIYTMGREAARDLSTSPAMIQGNIIVLRHETAYLFFWGKYEEMNAKRCSGALHNAFSHYGISRGGTLNKSADELGHLIHEVAKGELETYTYHEIGEATQRTTLGRWWKEMLLDLPYSRAEIFLRGLKDVLSDTCRSGMLSHIIENQKSGSLGFYVSLLSGFRRTLFLDIVSAYENFVMTADWSIIEEARLRGNRQAGDLVRELKLLSDQGKTDAEDIERLIPQV